MTYSGSFNSKQASIGVNAVECRKRMNLRILVQDTTIYTIIQIQQLDNKIRTPTSR